MFDLKNSIIPTSIFVEKLGVTYHQFYRKNKNSSFTDEEKATIFNIINNYPPIYSNIPLLDHYMRINNISLYDFRAILKVQENFFYSFKAIPLSDEPQRDIIGMLQNNEPLNLNKLIDPLANERVKRVLKKEGVNPSYFRTKFLEDHQDYKRYSKSYSSLFLNIEYTEEIKKEMVNYIKNNI